jgi:hypothetical protein
VEFVTLLIYSKQFKPWSCIRCNFIYPHIASSLSGPHTVLSNLLLRTLNLVSSLLMQQTGFHIHTKENQIIVSYTLIFTFLDGGRNDNTTNQWK